VLELYLGALGQAYDPHSVWFAPASKDDFDIQMRDALEGIGATLVREEDYITVKSLVPGGPAARANELQPGDRIVAVAQGGQKTDVVGMRIDHVVKLIRGPKGTDVVLTVIPAGAADASQTRDLRITRDQVVIAEAAAKGEVREVDGVKVGVIDVPSFYQDLSERGGKSAPRTTADDVRRILDGFKKDGVAAVLVDLRANGGGALTQAIALTGLFIDAGPVVQIKDRQGRVEVLEDREKGLAWEGPLAVVTSAHSASASEIFAGAIQDYGRGLVVGDSSTHGKGTVQQFIDLSPVVAGFQVPGAADVAGALKYTTDQFYRVSGRSTQQVGVEADVVIPSLSDGLDMGESSLPFALAYDEIDPARFRAWGQRPDRAALQRRSAERVGGDPRFQVMAELRALRDARDQDTISLDLDQRRQERSNWEELEKRAEAVGLEGEAVDPVLDEALRVVRDFVKG
jgi:carboxyl-terminal processing protease